MLYLDLNPSPVILSICLGGVVGDPLSVDAYGDNTPRLFEAAVAKAESAAWTPMVVFHNGVPQVLYWLHDRDDVHHGTWVGGYMLPWCRMASGSSEHERLYHRYLHRCYWAIAREAIIALGYPHIFFATLTENEASHRWVTEGFEAVQIGVHPSFLYHHGNLMPARLYAQKPEDATLGLTLGNQRAARLVPGWAG